MSVSAAISSANFEALEQAVTGKDNEVFSTILFDSYDDKRIEELLLLEAIEFMKENKPERYNIDAEWNNITSSWFTRNGNYNYYMEKSYYKTITFPEFQPLMEYYYENNGNRYIDASFNVVSLYIQSVQIKDFEEMFRKTNINIRKNDEELKQYFSDENNVNKLSVLISTSNPNYSSRSLALKMTNKDINFWRFYIAKWIDSIHGKYQDISIQKYSFDNISCTCHLTFLGFKRDINFSLQCTEDTSIKWRDEVRQFLLKRICERHAMNETLVQSMKKKLEIERLYYKMKDLYDEDVKLTRTINSKHEQLNSLQEDICAKKVEMNQLDMRILQAQNDLEALAYHHKQMELATEINNEVTLLEDDKEALDAKRMHDYYVNFANDLKVYKFAFEHMREISMKLEQERFRKV